MRLTIQNKLLLPIIAAVVALMLCSTLLITRLVTDRLVTAYNQELEIACLGLNKTVQQASQNYKTSILGMASTARLRVLADALSGGDQLAVRSAALQIQSILRAFTKIYTFYPVINIARADGLVVAGTNTEAIGKVNVGKRAYFRSAMEGDTTISEPIMSMDTKDKAAVVATPFFDTTRKPVGVLYAILPLRDIIANTVEGIRFGKTGFTYIVDEGGLMLAHPDYSMVQEMDMRKSGLGPALFDSASDSGVMDYKTIADQTERRVSFRRDASSGWISVAVMDVAEIREATDLIRNISLGIMLAGAALVGLIVFCVVRPIIKALLQGVDYAKAVADGDLDKPFTLRRGDELGTLFEALGSMVARLKEMISAAHKESENAQEQSRKAQEAMQQAEAAGSEAQAKTEAMLVAADKLEQMAGVVSSASTQLSAQIEQSDRGAAESASRLSEAATAMNQMNATVQEVARNAGSASAASAETREKAMAGSHIVESAVQSIAEVHGLSLELKEDMAQLNEHAQAITRIMNVISDIADQTNLLALNAAIEAARAGEAGRGFAVVADEVRNLAEKTMASTNDVGNAIKAIQESTTKSMTGVDQAVERIGQATELASRSGQALQEIVATVEATADQVNAIATASEEQSAASEEITQAIVQVNDMSRQTAEAMAEAAKAVSDLAAQAQGLTELIHNMKQG